MEFWKITLILIFYFTKVTGQTLERSEWIEEQEESRLLINLTRHYNPHVRPVRNASRAVIVRLSATLTQIFDLDEKNQVLTTNVWLDQEWYDELLTWEPTLFNNIRTFRIPCEKIWLPDIVLYNSADDYTRGYMRSKAMVRYDGNVFWPPPTKFRSTCPVDVTYFPFDDQICTLKLGSWTYDGFQVDVTNRTSQVDLSNYVVNGEWELLEARIVRNVVYYTCCPEPFPDVTITVVIRRKTLFYLYNVVLPCAMMSVLTLLVFCLPPDSGEKIALGITVLLAFSVFMLAIAEKMPETSESIPLIGIYLTAVMTITSLSVIMTVVVLNFHHRGPAKSPPSHLLKRLAGVRDNTDPCVQCAPFADNEPKFRHGREYSSTESVTAADDARDTYARVKRIARTAAPVPPPPPPPPSPSPPVAPISALQHEMMRTLRHLMAKRELQDRDAAVVDEWRQIARAVDRFLFWLFFAGTLASFLTVLVVVPLERRSHA